ncbi:autophagy protein 16, interacts with Atg12p-Atg5p [Claviceps sp. LM218 group G6]|nr:autophagy protein 16, interacts with Atg12p-Atg5p [Claviceps sp. LM218 group G6]KAG6101954.1 autophagy protein 16, interacts with Atg12p-Atg5p [Claviceps sp. LM454 group G7]
MSSWRDEYLTSLKDAELQSPVNQELIQTCSQMADRISALEASNAALEARASKAPKVKASKSEALPTTDDPAIAQLRLDLAESLRSKGVTEGRLRAAEEELSKLRTKTKDDARSVKALSTERALLTTRLKDREHELREKRKLLENVQDEMITLNLQISMAEKERDKVKRENKELVERWMARMAQEAEAMNLANEPLFGT